MLTWFPKNSSQRLDAQRHRRHKGLVVAAGMLAVCTNVEAIPPFQFFFRRTRAKDNFKELMITLKHYLPGIRRRMALNPCQN